MNEKDGYDEHKIDWRLPTVLVLPGTPDKPIVHPETGREWERRFLGYSADQFPRPQSQNWISALHHAISIETQRERNWNPQDPSTDEAYALYNAVSTKLQRHISNRLAMYNTIGTPMDRWHGVDLAFMIYNETDDVIVTIDLTVDPEKPDPRTSNRFIVRPENIDDLDELDRLASAIARELERLRGHSNNGLRTEGGAAKRKKSKRKKG